MIASILLIASISIGPRAGMDLTKYCGVTFRNSGHSGAIVRDRSSRHCLSPVAVPTKKPDPRKPLRHLRKYI